jgi:DNA-directed RNA polymerase subunit RPC12/RpoP
MTPEPINCTHFGDCDCIAEYVCVRCTKTNDYTSHKPEIRVCDDGWLEVRCYHCNKWITLEEA